MYLLNQLKAADYFTENERQIASYILENLAEIPNMTIEALAKETFTSHSAIVRLSQKLNFKGFREFKLALSKIVFKQVYTQETVNVNFPFEATDSPSQIAKKMADLTVETVKKAYAQLDEALILEVAETLEEADRIFLFSIGDSQIRARSFQNKLVKLNKFPILGDQYSDSAWNASNLTKKDCALFITYSAKVPEYQRIMTYLKGESVPTILLTGNPLSTLTPLASVQIAITQNEYDFLKTGTFASQITFEYVLNTIFSIMYAKNYNHNYDSLKNKYSLLGKGMLFENNIVNLD